MNSCQ